MRAEYEEWLIEVEKVLNRINMSMTDWQPIWPFDFKAAFERGCGIDEAAIAANGFWWRHQEEVLPRLRAGKA
jgi:hypothetical protein